jgi:trigger factor
VKVSVEKLPTSEAVLEVEVTWDEMEKASERAYRKLVKQVDVQGFRRGKAPRSLLERKLGKEYIYQEGLEDLISDAYRKAIQEHDLIPITRPKLDVPTFEMGQPYHFNMTVPIITRPVLGDYHSLHFEREEADVTSEEVEKEIESLRNHHATWHEVERPADYDDRITVDLKLTIEGKDISDLKDNPFELTKERHGLFVGLDEQVVGMMVGETREFSTTIPADYNNEKLAGKQATYLVTLHKVEEKQLPELDDAFASAASKGQYESLEDLRKAISDEILETKKRQIRDRLREKVVEAIIEQAQFNIHPLLIEEEAEEILHQFSHLLEQQRLTLDQYLMITRQSREEYLNSLKPNAEKRVKQQLVLDEIADKEEISVAPEEIEALYRAYAQSGQPLQQTEAQTRALLVNYRREKTITHLVELTTDADLDAVSAVAEPEEASIEKATAAAQAAAGLTTEVEAASSAPLDALEVNAVTATGEPAIGDSNEGTEAGA